MEQSAPPHPKTSWIRIETKNHLGSENSMVKLIVVNQAPDFTDAVVTPIVSTGRAEACWSPSAHAAAEGEQQEVRRDAGPQRKAPFEGPICPILANLQTIFLSTKLIVLFSVMPLGPMRAHGQKMENRVESSTFEDFDDGPLKESKCYELQSDKQMSEENVSETLSSVSESVDKQMSEAKLLSNDDKQLEEHKQTNVGEMYDYLPTRLCIDQYGLMCSNNNRNFFGKQFTGEDG